MGRPPAFLSAQEFLQLLEADPPRARGYLRHPVWRSGNIPRCDCSCYALLYGIQRLIDHDLVHAPRLCQPHREVIW